MRIWSAVLIALFVLGEGAAQVPSNSIAGIVWHQVTSQPLGGVRVTMQPIDPLPPNSTPAVAIQSRTDSQGRFAVLNVPSGRYILRSEMNGFVRQESQIVKVANGIQIPPVEELNVTLTPTGTITGTVYNQQGEPASGVPVRLLNFQYDSRGTRSLLAVQWARTNDRGEYRFYYVTPGTYYLAAGTGAEVGHNDTPRDPNNRGVVATLNETVSDLAYMYYPGVADRLEATVLTVMPGAELAAINLVLPLRVFSTIRGKVLDSSGQTVDAQVSISFEASTGRKTIAGINAAGGAFEIPDVAPGWYAISAAPVSTNRMAVGPSELRTSLVANIGSANIGGLVVLQVRDAVHEVVLPFTSGRSIRGQVQLEGRALPGFEVNKVKVELRWKLPADAPIGIVPQLPAVPVELDGTFAFTNVPVGEYSLSVPISGFRMKEANYGNIDLVQEPLRYTGSESQQIRVVLTPNFSNIHGVVMDGGRPVAGAQVVLVPEQPGRNDAFRAATTDESGRFEITDVAQGAYSSFAWRPPYPYAFFDPEIPPRLRVNPLRISVYEAAGQSITLQMNRVRE